MKLLFLQLLSSIILNCYSQIPSTWIGKSQGHEREWSFQTNWDNNQIPDELTDVIIPLDESFNDNYPVIENQIPEINSLRIPVGSHLSIQNGNIIIQCLRKSSFNQKQIIRVGDCIPPNRVRLSSNHHIQTAIGQTEKYTWVGTIQGLYRINNQTGRTYFFTEKNSNLPANMVTSIVCYPDGQTLISTHKGILIWDNYTFILITTENSGLPENDILKMTLDHEGLFIKTKHHGMLKAIGKSLIINKFEHKGIKKVA